MVERQKRLVVAEFHFGKCASSLTTGQLRREPRVPAEDVTPRLVDDIRLLAVEDFHFIRRPGSLWERCRDLILRIARDEGGNALVL